MITTSVKNQKVEFVENFFGITLEKTSYHSISDIKLSKKYDGLKNYPPLLLEQNLIPVHWYHYLPTKLMNADQLKEQFTICVNFIGGWFGNGQGNLGDVRMYTENAKMQFMYFVISNMLHLSQFSLGNKKEFSKRMFELTYKMKELFERTKQKNKRENFQQRLDSQVLYLSLLNEIDLSRGKLVKSNENRSDENKIGNKIFELLFGIDFQYAHSDSRLLSKKLIMIEKCDKCLEELLNK